MVSGGRLSSTRLGGNGGSLARLRLRASTAHCSPFAKYQFGSNTKPQQMPAQDPQRAATECSKEQPAAAVRRGAAKMTVPHSIPHRWSPRPFRPSVAGWNSKHSRNQPRTSKMSAAELQPWWLFVCLFA